MSQVDVRKWAPWHLKHKKTTSSAQRHIIINPFSFHMLISRIQAEPHRQVPVLLHIRLNHPSIMVVYRMDRRMVGPQDVMSTITSRHMQVAEAGTRLPNLNLKVTTPHSIPCSLPTHSRPYMLSILMLRIRMHRMVSTHHRHHPVKCPSRRSNTSISISTNFTIIASLRLM